MFTIRHTKYGRIRGMVVDEAGRSSGVLLYSKIALVKQLSLALETVHIMWFNIGIKCEDISLESRFVI